jgi:hypothetical protein
MENQVFKDFTYIDHPCENLNFIDDLIYSKFSKDQVIEEYCLHVSKDEILNKKKYYIFQINKIKNKKILFDILKKTIKHLKLKNFKYDIYKYINQETGINLNNLILININKKIIQSKINHFIIKVDQNNNFGLYIGCIDQNASTSNPDGRSISIKNGILINKLYKITKYVVDSRESKYNKLWADEINLNDKILESKYEPLDFEFANKNFKTSYLTNESNDSIGFYYRKINNYQSKNISNILRIYFRN